MFYIELEPIYNNEGAVFDFEFSLDFSDYPYNGGFPFREPVRVSGQVKNSTGIVTLKAKAEFTLSLTCDRCAQALTRSFWVPVDHTLVTEVNDETNDELIVTDTFRYDVEPLITEDIILYLPTKIICRDDCAGICSRCGKNLNDGPCDCKKEIDPRWAALSLFTDEEDS